MKLGFTALMLMKTETYKALYDSANSAHYRALKKHFSVL